MTGGKQRGATTTTGGGNRTGIPKEKFTDQPACAEAANPVTATTATKPKRCFVFMNGSTAGSRVSSTERKCEMLLVVS